MDERMKEAKVLEGLRNIFKHGTLGMSVKKEFYEKQGWTQGRDKQRRNSQV